MIIDAFLYAGEREALDIRERELNGDVLLHLAVEGALTFQGAVRTPSFAADLEGLNIPRRAIQDNGAFLVNDFPTDADSWGREEWQRNAISRALAAYRIPDDAVILISDADEIPNYETVPKRLAPGETGRLCMQHSMYFVNLRCVSFGHWHGTRFIRWDDLQKTTPQTLRGFGVGHTHMPGDRPNGGNHFSFLGGAEAIQRKLASWAHTEANALNTPENIERALQALTDWDQDRAAQLVPVPLDDSFPACIREHPERYSVLPVGVPA